MVRARCPWCAVGLVGLACVAATPASGQVLPIVSFPWDSVLSGGPRAQDYPPAQDNLDVWVVEDFVTDRPWRLGTFRSTGSGIGGASDVVVVVLTDWPGPGGGTEVMRSSAGTGRYVPLSPPQWGWYEASFEGQRLEPGSYKIMWQVRGGSGLVPVVFVRHGAYDVGVGLPDNAYQYNPGGGWAMPEGVLDPITDQLNHQGNPIGVNFALDGEPAPACDPDINADGNVDQEDVACLIAAAAGSPGCAAVDLDFNADGNVDQGDVDSLLNVVAGGSCP